MSDSERLPMRMTMCKRAQAKKKIIHFLFFILFDRINLERQLKDILLLYDREIGHRSDQLMQYKKILEHEAATLASWNGKYEKQEILYNQIQADNEAEELQQREQLILLFLMNRAARIIQKVYRRILEQRKAKRKGKGRKGGRGKK